MSFLFTALSYNIFKGVLTIFLITSLCNCSNNSGNSIKITQTDGFQQNHGPFDSNGNYIEDWADNPPERKIAWKPNSPQKLTSKPVSQSVSQPIIAANTPPSSMAPRSASVPVRKTTPPTVTQVKKPTSPTVIKKSTPPPTVAKKPATTTSPPKTTAKKITPKTKPPVFHTIKKGDTLSALARNYGASVLAIQKANNIKGTNIVVGKQLIIPRN